MESWWGVVVVVFAVPLGQSGSRAMLGWVVPECRSALVLVVGWSRGVPASG